MFLKVAPLMLLAKLSERTESFSSPVQVNQYRAHADALGRDCSTECRKFVPRKFAGAELE